MNGVTPTKARDFYRAAASFYRQAPWVFVDGDVPTKINCDSFEGGFRYAIVVGKKGKVRGFWLCDDWNSCVLFERGRYEAIAEHVSYTALQFGSRKEIIPNDLEKIVRHGFEVAGPEAFPFVVRKEPGADFRSPDAKELEILEACLFVIPDFLKRAEDRKLDVYEYAFKGSDGKMSLDLSWVSKERLGFDHQQDRPDDLA